MIRERFLTDRVVEALGTSRVACILGPRQAGKSTLAFEIAKRGEGMPTVTLDNAHTRAAAAEDPVGFVAAVDRPTVIDEIQRVPDLLLAIKERVDRDSRRGQFLLTGSANILTLPVVADALPGRVRYLTLFPFSQEELAGQQGVFIEKAFSGKVPLIRSEEIGRSRYVKELVRGGYPEAQLLDISQLRDFFDGYLDSLITRTLEDAISVQHPRGMRQMLRMIAAQSGSIVRFANLSNDLNLSDKTLRRYVEALERIFILERLEPWYRNLGQRLIKSPKYYLTDSGLLARLLAVTERQVVNDGDVAGRLFEAFAIGELVRQRTYSREALDLFFYRDKEGREVDLVLERDDGSVVAIEIKASATVGGKHFSALKFLRDRLGDRFKAGIVFNTGAETVPFGDRLWAVPLSGLWSDHRDG